MFTTCSCIRCYKIYGTNTHTFSNHTPYIGGVQCRFQEKGASETTADVREQRQNFYSRSKLISLLAAYRLKRKVLKQFYLSSRAMFKSAKKATSIQQGEEDVDTGEGEKKPLVTR